MSAWQEGAGCTRRPNIFWERSMSSYPSRYYRVLLAGLVLFGFSLAISKSACNVLLFLVYPAAIAGMLRYKDFKETIFSNIRQPLTFAFLLYFLVSLVGVLYSQQYSDGFHTANKFLSLLAIYVMVSVLLQTVQDEQKRYQQAEKILFAFLLGLVILNVIGIMTYFGIVGHKKFELPLSPMHVHHIWFSNINALGLYTAASFLMFSPHGKSARGKVFMLSFILLASLCILLSLSRTAWFGIILTSLIMFLLSATNSTIKNKKAFFAAAAALLVAIVVIYKFTPFVHDRIGMINSDIAKLSVGETTTATGAPTSLGARYLMWKAAFMMFQSNPLFGVGTGDYMTTMVAYVESGQAPKSLLEFNQPHNIYLFTLATNGLIGLAALLYLFYRAIAFSLPLLKGKHQERLFAFLGIATVVHFMIAGITDSFFNIQILRYAFAFIIGVCLRTTTVSGRRD